MDVQQFIEVRRVLSDKITKENRAIELETIDVSLIKGFRAWHKGPKDLAIEGDMTLVILKPDEKPVRDFAKLSEEELDLLGVMERAKYDREKELYEKEVLESKKSHSILIQASYKDFSEEMSKRVVIRKVNETP